MLLRQRFRQWRQGRPFWGALLTILAGLELFITSQFDLAFGGVQLQLGFSGMQTTIIPVVLVLVGALAMVQPVHHVFYGVIGLALAVYSLVAVNGGGLVAGTVLGVVGGIVVVSWMGRARAEAPLAPPVPAPPAAPSEDPLLVFDDGPERDAYGRRSTAAVLSVALLAGGLAGAPALVPAAVPADGPCLLGILLCGTGATPAPTPTVSPSPGDVVEGAPGERVDVDGDGTLDGVLKDVTGDGILDVLLGEDGLGGLLDGVGQAVADAGEAVSDAVGGAPGGSTATPGADASPTPEPGADASAQPGAAGSGTSGAGAGGSGTAGSTSEPPTGDGVTVEVPPQLPLPKDEGYPVVLGGNDSVDVYSIPAELKTSDLKISGLRAVALVSVPVEGTSGKRRNAIKVVADHIKTTGFRLKTYAEDGGSVAGTYTVADSVTMDGHATIYITSLTASGPDGSSLALDADKPPTTVTGLLLALVDPTIGLLGATSDTQTWSGFHESVWQR